MLFGNYLNGFVLMKTEKMILIRCKNIDGLKFDGAMRDIAMQIRFNNIVLYGVS